MTEADISVTIKQGSMEQDVDSSHDNISDPNEDHIKSEVFEGPGSLEVVDTRLGITVGNVKDVGNAIKKEIGLHVNPDVRIGEDNSMIADTKLQLKPLKVEEEDCDFLADDFMDSLDVVDSWNDATDDMESPRNEQNTEDNSPVPNESAVLNLGKQHVDQMQGKEGIEKVSQQTNNDKGGNISRERDGGCASRGKKGSEKCGTVKNNLDRKKVDKDTNEQSLDNSKSNRSSDHRGTPKNEQSSDYRKLDRSSDRRGRSPDSGLRKERESRRGRSFDRSNKSTDRDHNSRRNTERGVDRGYSSQKNSYISSRTSTDRDTHSTSRRNTNRDHNQRSGDPNRNSNRTSSSQKRDRSSDRNRHSSKSQSSTGKGGTTVNVANTDTNPDRLKKIPSLSRMFKKIPPSNDVNPLMFKKIPPLVEKLVPPGTEDDLVTKSVGSTEKTLLPESDTLVPPGTVEVLLPDVTEESVEKQLSTSSKKRKTRSSDNSNIMIKSLADCKSSQNERGKQGAEKRRRMTSTEKIEITRKTRPIVVEHDLTLRERIADQERISRELNIHWLRDESRNHEKRRDRDRFMRDSRERLVRESSLERQRHENEMFNRRLRDRRSSSFERHVSHMDTRWETSSRDRFDRRHLELSPVSPGRMSRSSPLSFEFSPVSSRSSSRERFKLEYQRNKFRSYSPISSGSELSRSMDSISSDEEREPRSRRRKRLPFLDEMERKLGLKLTGGHNINQQLRTSQQFSEGFEIDVSAPPPGTYPLGYPPTPVPPPVAYQPHFPPINPIYPSPTLLPTPPVATELYKGPALVRHGVSLPICPRPSTSKAVPTRHLTMPPREPQSVLYTFQRVVQNEETELPEAPPPPTISAVAAQQEMSLSSILEASVKGSLEATKASAESKEKPIESTGVGGKNPVDPARVQRCQVAIQTLQEDESFSMISSGRFIVQPVTNPLYAPTARFDHPAQEAMFQLKSPLLRNQHVSLKFTTPPAVPYKLLVSKAAKEKESSNTNQSPPKSSIWPKNSDKPPKKPAEPEVLDPKEDEDPDVWIVEKTETVFSISSESDHEMNLSLVSDISDVCDDDGDDKLENVSSGEEDFTQCATCVERNREKKFINASTQCRRKLGKRSVSLQVDLVNQQLEGSFNIISGRRVRSRRGNGQNMNPSFGDNLAPNQTKHSNVSPSFGSSNSSNEPISSSTAISGDQPSISAASRFASSGSINSSNTLFLTSSTNQLSGTQPPVSPASKFVTSISNKFSSNQPSTSHGSKFIAINLLNSNKTSNKLPVISSTNQFDSSSVSKSTNNLSSSFNTNKPYQANLSNTPNYSSPTVNYKSYGPFQTGSQPCPTRGILKSSCRIDTQPSQSVPAAGNFQQNNQFQPSQPFQGPTLSQQQQQQPYVGNQSSLNRQGIGAPSYQSQTSYSSFQSQVNTNFGNPNSFGAMGNMPAMVPAPTPVPAPTYNQQNFPNISGGHGMNRDKHQSYFNPISSDHQDNYYQPGQY